MRVCADVRAWPHAEWGTLTSGSYEADHPVRVYNPLQPNGAMDTAHADDVLDPESRELGVKAQLMHDT